MTVFQHHRHSSEMSYFRQTRSSRPALGLGILTFLCLAWFFLSSTTDLSATLDPLLRARKSAAAASNPLSPPTSAFRKSRQGSLPALPPPIVHYQLNNLSSTAHPVTNNEKILILTPLARFYPEYWTNLCALSYPHEHISLGFIITKTTRRCSKLSKGHSLATFRKRNFSAPGL